MKNFKCTLSDEGINLEFSGCRLLVSYDYPGVTRDRMRDLAEAQGGKMPSWEQAASIAEHRVEINKALREAGKPELSGWCWLDREYSTDTRFAWCVNILNGDTGYDGKSDPSHVRAVSAFPAE